MNFLTLELPKILVKNYVLPRPFKVNNTNNFIFQFLSV